MSDLHGNPNFQTTHWSIVSASRDSDNLVRTASLTTLYTQYWYPLFAYLRHKGSDPDLAADYVQGFFAELIEKDFLEAVSPDRGRFRWFLMSAIGRYVSKQRERDAAQKRGGDRTQFSLNVETAEQRYQSESADQWTAERLFDRRWALQLLGHSLSQLHDEYKAKDKLDLYLALQHTLIADATSQETYADIASRFNLSESAIKVTALRMRDRYRQILCQNVAQTVADPDSIDQELDELLAALRGD